MHFDLTVCKVVFAVTISYLPDHHVGSNIVDWKNVQSDVRSFSRWVSLDCY